MNTTARRLVSAVLVLATASAAVIALSGAGSATEPQVIVMPRVEVVGKREVVEPMRVVTLPMVEVTGRRPATMVAQQSARGVRG